MTTVLTLLGALAALIAVILGLGAVRTRTLTDQAEAAVPRTGALQAVPGGAVHYVESGPAEAPPVLLIHGLGGQLQHYTYALAPLLARDFRVIAIDRPGSGWSERDGADKAALPEQARMIAEFLQARGIERPTVVGHSLGGAVALALALDHPDRVGPLALLCPLSHPLGTIQPVFRGLDVGAPWLRKLLGATIAAPMAERMADRTLAAVFAPEAAPADFVTRGGAALGLRPKGYVGASEDLTAAGPSIGPMVKRYPDLQAKGGILYGADDALLSPAAHGEALAAVTPLTLETLPGRGHMIPITAPEDCAAFIRRMAALR